MNKYYPNYIDNELFIYLINQLPPQIREEKDTINKLFELIINLNSVKDKLMLYTAILPKESLLKLFKDVNIIRKDIYIILETLKFSGHEINKLLINLGSKLNSKLLNNNSEMLSISNNTKENHKDINVDNIEYSDDFIESWQAIEEILLHKLKLSDKIINKDKELFKDIFNLIQFCIINKIDNINSINNI